MQRAIRRLGVLEQLFLLLAAVGALVAGALVAWLLGQALGLPFRPTWAISALTLFVVPAVISFLGVRRNERPRDQKKRDDS
jgi:predicted lysophospholipase L1 biosynthesis ABC-type transport system permease subunit